MRWSGGSAKIVCGGNGSGDKSNKSMAKEGSQPVTQSTHIGIAR